MKRIYFAVLVIIMVLSVAAPALAGIPGWDAVKTWVGGTAVAFLLTGILAIGVIGAFVARYTPILGAVGWFLISIDNAASDGKITKEELGEIKAKWNAVRDKARAAKNG